LPGPGDGDKAKAGRGHPIAPSFPAIDRRSVMTIRLTAILALTLVGSVPAVAALSVGAKAPDFATQASLGGKRFTFSLSEALKKGPVALYFYPAAFTKGCTIEAHDFAEATDEFSKLGATVIGVSADDIATLDRFSVSECRSKFAVASADAKLIKRFDVVFPDRPLSNRTTYVITPDRRIIWVYSALKPDGHVAGALKAVSDWRAAHPKAD
jgi:peroxiredoxin